jgi:Protein of unknown function (DUF2505)
VRFRVEQRLAGPVDAVQAVFVEPGFYADLAQLPKLGAPDLLDQRRQGDVVVQRVRYRFTGELSSAARAVLDPARLTWVDESVHDLAARTVRFRLLPDHYADRFSCSGTYSFAAAAGDRPVTVRTADGELRVRAAFVGGAVERAIVNGLRDHLAAETPIVERWVGRASGP